VTGVWKEKMSGGTRDEEKNWTEVAASKYPNE
jgi:hypothetical protein